MALAAFIVSIFSLLSSVVALIFTRMNAKLQLLGQLYSGYLNIHARMDSRYRDEKWFPERKKPEWIPLEEYWYFCHYEYMVTKGSKHRTFASIWDNYVSKGVIAGLKHRALRYVLHTIREEGGLQDVYAQDFINELISLYGSNFFELEDFSQPRELGPGQKQLHSEAEH
jgi:hypothetical protein